MGMQLMPINIALYKKMTNEQLAGEFQQKRNNIGFELLGMGAILVERKDRPYEGDFKDVIRNEFNFAPSKGYLLMKAWKERDSYIDKVQPVGLNYTKLEVILSIPLEDRADFIEQEHPEEKSKREAKEAAQKYKELKEQLQAEKNRREMAEEKAAQANEGIENLFREAKKKFEENRTLTQRAAEAEGKNKSLEMELMHKQATIDALKHEQKMAEGPAEPQVVYQDSPDTAARIKDLEHQLEEARILNKRTVERAEWAEKSAKEEMELKLRAEANLQALKNGMSLQVYSKEHEELDRYQSTHEEDYKTAEKALKWLSNINQAPQTKPEMEEWVRCVLMDLDDKPHEMISYRDNVETAMKKLQMMYEALTPGGLKVVK